MQIRKPSTSRFSKLGKPQEFTIMRIERRKYHPDKGIIESCDFRLDQGRELNLSWTEIEFFAEIYHKYKVKHA